MGKKELLANILYRSGLLHGISRALPKALTILGYHRIRPDGPWRAVPFDGGVFGPTQSEFERQVKWLKQNFTLLSESDLLSTIKSNSFRDNYVVLTFDDGYRDNYELVYPVLKAHNVPAIFFVCPGLVETRRVGWWDSIAYLVKRSAKPAISLNGETFPMGVQKGSTISRLHEWMKRRPSEETDGLVAKVSDACGVPPPDAALQNEQLMTWAQIEEVDRNGVTIASHTYSHRVLATIPEEDQFLELRDSKAALENRLGRMVRTVAYPAGRYTATTMRLARECNYAAGFSYHTGANAAGSIDPYEISRIAPTDESCPLFACSTLLPGVFTWVQRD